MKTIPALFLMVSAGLAAAGAAHAQRVAGGMGEEVRLGAFSEPGHASRNRDYAANIRTFKAGPGRTPVISQQPRHAVGRSPVVTLPGKHLP